ncbi:hypothetical protein [Caudoviricetes sp.]|nr:hypothetical protein [Caudoviricetes sp.]
MIHVQKGSLSQISGKPSQVLEYLTLIPTTWRIARQHHIQTRSGQTIVSVTMYDTTATDIAAQHNPTTKH